MVYHLAAYTQPKKCVFINHILNLSADKELILGDFNIPSLSWNDEDMIDMNIPDTDTLFVDLFKTISLSQWVKNPTFINSGIYCHGSGIDV